MDNVVWVAIAGLSGTLAGVWLGNWLQSRNIKQQREWMLQDQKREWMRKQKRDKFERILGYVEGTLQYLSKMNLTLKFKSTDKAEELILNYSDQAASLMAIHHVIENEDKKLADLVLEFSQILATFNTSAGKDFEIDGKEYRRLSRLAGSIRQRIDELLEETYT